MFLKNQKKKKTADLEKGFQNRKKFFKLLEYPGWCGSVD